MARAAASRARGSLNGGRRDRKSTRLNSSHLVISYAVFCLKKKKQSCKSFVYVSKASVNIDIYLKRVDERNPTNLTRDYPTGYTMTTFSAYGSLVEIRSNRI